MSTKIPNAVDQTPPLKEQGISALAVSQMAQVKLERISEERIYEETAKVAAIFWEWRHKIMTHFFTGMAALVALIGWLYQRESVNRLWLCVPLIIGAVFSFVCYLMDKRNKVILEKCYQIGKDIDSQAHNGGGIFSFIDALHSTGGSYSQILKRLYLISALVLAGLSLVLIIAEWWKSA